MKIAIGQIFLDENGSKMMLENATRRYLFPCLKEYGEEFVDKISNVFKIAVGIGDVIVYKAGLKYHQHIFILIDTTISSDFFIDFISWIKDQPMYEDDYVFDNIQKTNMHMVVIKFPERLEEAIDKFREGRYSSMFDVYTIQELFSRHIKTSLVLTKNENYKPVFVKEINTKFNTDLKVSEYEGELDFPLKEAEEVFNY